VLASLALACALPLLAACRREAREPRADPPVAAALGGIALLPGGIGGSPPQVYFVLGAPYRRNAYQLSEGKRLFGWFGCR
jgi:cytochrome c oxidase cbb3-type subunit 3